MLKSRIFLNFGMPLFYFLFYCNGVKAGTKANRYQVILRNANACVSPQPPYSQRQPVVPVIEIYTSKGRAYIRGNTTIKAPAPFRNGFYPYFVDVDKITHSLPIWHEQGRMVHHLQLVACGATLVCAEVHVEVQSTP